MGKTQISREGDRFEVPKDISILSGLVTTMIEIDKDGDGNDIEKGIDEMRKNEIPLVSINTPVLVKIVRLLEYYKQEPSEFVMCLAWFVIKDVNPLSTFLRLRWLYYLWTITLPFISLRIDYIF